MGVGQHSTAGVSLALVFAFAQGQNLLKPWPPRGKRPTYPQPNGPTYKRDVRNPPKFLLASPKPKKAPLTLRRSGAGQTFAGAGG